MTQPLDPELEEIYIAQQRNNAPPLFSGIPEEARERFRKGVLKTRFEHKLVSVRSVEDCVAEYARTRVPVRVYRPETRDPIPTIVFFHGGGFVLGSVELMDHIARKLCRDVNSVVISVDYRLAPESQFPAAHDDAWAATLWAIKNAYNLGGDSARVAVAGESAGANLAASTAITLRDQNIELAAQLLVSPGLDFARDYKEIKNEDYPMLKRSDLKLITELYLGSNINIAHRFPPSPMRAKDFSGLAPALIAVAGHDPLKGEGLAYAENLLNANVPVSILRFDDMFHPFFGFFALSESARRAHDTICLEFSKLLVG